MTITPLLELLEQSYESHLNLKQISEQKQQAIIHNRIEDLSKLVGQENKLIKQIEKLEAAREELCAACMREQGFMPAGKITLKTVIGVTHQPELKQQLLDLYAKLSEVLAELQELNKLNQQLIEQSLSFIQFNLDLIIDDSSETVTYQNPASAPKAKLNYSSFDTRA